MATSQKSRHRRPSRSSDRSPRHVEPVLDPSWQSPYTPTTEERQNNLASVRRYAWRQRTPWTIVATVVVVALGALSTFAIWFAALAVVCALAYAIDLRRAVASSDRRARTLGDVVLAQFSTGGSRIDHERLDTLVGRLTATFGVEDVETRIVEDATYNAALVPQGESLCLLVTTAIMNDFELIELEGVIAHCFARQRLGLVARECAASLVKSSEQKRRELAGVGASFRADQVAAATIRYPLGLAGALRKCARQVASGDSFFASANYGRWRWVFFNQRSDSPETDLTSLDDPELRARALEEW